MLRQLLRRLRGVRVVDEPGGYPADYSGREANYYYFGHHKAATNWMRRLLRDVCRRAEINYLVYRGDSRHNAVRPGNRAAFHLLVNSFYRDLQCLGPGDRAFNLIRDPRDALVSSYFSWRGRHRIDDEGQRRVRAGLRARSVEDGILYMLDHCHYFDQMGNWELGSDARVLDVRYEDLVADELGTFSRILQHLGIALPEDEVRAAVESSSFESVAGRRRGQEDASAHLRKGVVGDWHNYFGEDGPLRRAVYDRIGYMIDRLGYQR